MLELGRKGEGGKEGRKRIERRTDRTRKSEETIGRKKGKVCIIPQVNVCVRKGRYNILLLGVTVKSCNSSTAVEV